jgi:hypothetical protein
MTAEQWFGLGGAVVLVVIVIFAFRKATTISKRDRPENWPGYEHHTHHVE